MSDIPVFPFTVGVTGTRKGWNFNQKINFMEFLNTVTFHYLRHGQCIGVDEEVAEACWKKTGINITAHPGMYARSFNGDRTEVRSQFNHNEHVWPADLFKNRNYVIVNKSDAILGFPKEEIKDRRLFSGLRGGTIHTLDYAIAIRRPTYIFNPSGLMLDREFNPVTVSDIRTQLIQLGLIA